MINSAAAARAAGTRTLCNCSGLLANYPVRLASSSTLHLPAYESTLHTRPDGPDTNRVVLAAAVRFVICRVHGVFRFLRLYVRVKKWANSRKSEKIYTRYAFTSRAPGAAHFSFSSSSACVIISRNWTICAMVT